MSTDVFQTLMQNYGEGGAVQQLVKRYRHRISEYACLIFQRPFRSPAILYQSGDCKILEDKLCATWFEYV